MQVEVRIRRYVSAQPSLYHRSPTAISPHTYSTTSCPRTLQFSAPVLRSHRPAHRTLYSATWACWKRRKGGAMTNDNDVECS